MEIKFQGRFCDITRLLMNLICIDSVIRYWEGKIQKGKNKVTV